MNRKNECQKQKKNKIVMTVILFACLLTGATAYGLLHTNSSKQKSTSVEAVSTMSVSALKEQQLIPGKSISKKIVPQMNAIPTVMIHKEGTSLKVEKLFYTQPEPSGKPIQKEASKPNEMPIVPKEVKVKKESSGFVYNKEIPLPKEHQKYLYRLSQERGLDYEKTLAVIKHESGYDPTEISGTNDYGYFQVNKINHEELSEKLDTPNKPLDPYININWGTYKLSELYSYWEEKGVMGNQLDEYVWSSYNKGIGGFRKHGKATKYVKKVREALTEVHALM
jgi:hypothetical protein